ncbi:MAG: Gfo/Idh/MocA family oxidoreductase [Acetobacteraceae bacterium]|nr:Gfo/Idh/MocA family oxidoreductase [Acetobacteraceae bacterium]
MRRIGLIGAGFIARIHAEALQSLPNLRISAVVDPNRDASARLAETSGAAQTFTSVDDALSADAFDCAHVLVPPPLHCAVAKPILEAGKPVLLEKPLATNDVECEALLAAAARSGAEIGVNQNFLYHPAFARLRRLLAERALGKPNFLSAIYNVPLRQLAAKQFGHWMFAEPVNLLLEQAVHPLSQIATLAGTIGDISVQAGPKIELAPGVPFHASLGASLRGADLPAQLRFAVGQSFPFWQLSVVCDDGVAVADILANRLITYRRTRWMEAVDGLASGTRTAAAVFGASVRNLGDYAATTLRIRRSDAFFRSMGTSIAAFYGALDSRTSPPIDGRFGATLVATCRRIADVAFAPASTPRPARRTTTAPCDVAVIGGTGFIGAHVVRQFLAAGAHVAVMARSMRTLPAVFDAERVTRHSGDTRNAEAVAAAIGTAPVVVNLAHGGASGKDVRNAMVGGAEVVARASQGRRLIHIGSIAALYLGPQAEQVTGATPPDPLAEQRGDYARAKAITDRMLLGMDGLEVCILRPGLVVGEGGTPFHSGLGFFNNEQHCIGWNAGRNPLPFVLVEDVADAIVRAASREGLAGRCYNLVGDVRPSARAYIAMLAEALQRPLSYHPQSVDLLLAQDYAKFAIKRLTRRDAPLPSRRDLLSRGLRARFDCDDAKRDLGWSPVADPARFRERAILVHAGST